MQQQQTPIDLKNTEPIFTENGGALFQSGFILRRVSKFITGNAEDGIMPIQVFFDPVSNKIISDSVPSEIREEMEEHYKSLQNSEDSEKESD